MEGEAYLKEQVPVVEHPEVVGALHVQVGRVLGGAAMALGVRRVGLHARHRAHPLEGDGDAPVQQQLASLRGGRRRAPRQLTARAPAAHLHIWSLRKHRIRHY